jgi:steroid delta-isomerase-like uncharacterized protein
MLARFGRSSQKLQNKTILAWKSSARKVLTDSRSGARLRLRRDFRKIEERSSSMSEQNKSLVRRFVDEVWNRRDTSRLEEFLTPQCSSQTPDGTIHGLKEYRQHLDNYIKAFPDCKLTIDDLAGEGDTVFARCTLTGTNKGELRGIPATGKHFREQGIMMLKFSGGKVNEEVGVWDRLSMLEQLGIAPETMKQASRKAGR